MEIIILTVTGFLLIFFLFQLFKKSKIPVYDKIHEKKTSPCPLCGTMLVQDQKVKSVVYPGKPDSLVEMFGCPNCYPNSQKIKRICPVCKKSLGPEDYVNGRMFQKDTGIKHLHINGCTMCMRRKR